MEPTFMEPPFMEPHLRNPRSWNPTPKTRNGEAQPPKINTNFNIYTKTQLRKPWSRHFFDGVSELYNHLLRNHLIRHLVHPHNWTVEVVTGREIRHSVCSLRDARGEGLFGDVRHIYPSFQSMSASVVMPGGVLIPAEKVCQFACVKRWTVGGSLLATGPMQDLSRLFNSQAPFAEP